MPDAAASTGGQSLVLVLRHLAQHLTSMVESALVPAGVTLRHYGVLTTVLANPGQNQREIGEILHIDRTTVVALADELELAGLLERRRGADRRSFALHLTQEGHDRTMRLQAMVAQAHADFLSPLTSDEQVSLFQLALKLMEATAPMENRG